MKYLFILIFVTHLLNADSILNTATTLVQKHESFRSKAYIDSTGNLTIGYGTNIRTGITEEEALILLQFRLAKLQRKLNTLEWFRKLNAVRKIAILDLAYNVGYTGLLTFKDMIWCIEHKYFKAAGNRLLKSLYAKQTKKRAKYIAFLIQHG